MESSSAGRRSPLPTIERDRILDGHRQDLHPIPCLGTVRNLAIDQHITQTRGRIMKSLFLFFTFLSLHAFRDYPKKKIIRRFVLHTRFK